MAGFLAPQISDIGASRGGGGGVIAASADTSVGDALSGVAKIFDAFAGLKPPTVTQKDRDTETLRPFAQDISRLFAQRDKLGSRQYNARLSSVTSAFAAANPQLISESQTLVEAITGIKVGTDEFDFAGETQKTVVNWLLNDPEGRVAAPRVFKYDENGELNMDLTIIAGVEAMAQASVDEAKLVGLKTQLEIELAGSGINEVRLKKVVDEELFRFGREAQEHFEGVVRGALATGATISDGATVLGQLRDQRGALANKFQDEARKGGYANHPDWDVGIALSSYDNAIEALEGKVEDLPKILSALEALDSISLGNAINGIMGVGGFQRDFTTYLLSNMAVGESSQFSGLAKELRESKTLNTLADTPLFTPEATPVTEKNLPVEGGSTTPEAKAAAADLSRDERQGEVKFGLANFGAYLTENSKDENYRATAMKGFVLASVAITKSLQPLGVDIFDRMYNTKFFDTYKSIVSFGDESSGRLQNEVKHNLAVVFEQRKGLARQVLSNFFPSLPSLGLNFVDNKINLVFTTFGPGVTELEKSFLARLDQLGLSRDLAGIMELEKTGKGFLSATGFGPNLVNLENLNKEIRYLNKIVSTIVRLPDLSEHLLPQIEKGFTTRPVFNTVEEYNTTYPNLPHGQEYFVVGEGGGLTLEKKGFESFLFKGTRDE